MSKTNKSTLSALMKEKRKRGRPPRAVSRQNVYVTLSKAEKGMVKAIGDALPPGFQRADVPDIAITLLAARLEQLRRSVADRSREMPEGITDLESLYLLWDLTLPDDSDRRWTTVRLSPQPSIELGRAHGVLHALYGTSRSDVYRLALILLAQFVKKGGFQEWDGKTMGELQEWLPGIYL